VKRIVIATGNAHKVEEFQLAFEGERDKNGEEIEFVALSSLGDFPEPIEDGLTFEENAHIKACAAHKNTGLAALADDSGLEVDALNGAPGIYSSRYANGEGDAANNAKLLRELSGVPYEKRTARFRCALSFIDGDGTEITVSGACEGKIAFEEYGSNGFGYDPLFDPDSVPGKRMSELTMSEKQRISHRGAAIKKFKEALNLQ
jgi:XTP/dITP diphosphohydrolase